VKRLKKLPDPASRLEDRFISLENRVSELDLKVKKISRGLLMDGDVASLVWRTTELMVQVFV
jgi:hypothetical protein